MRIRTLLPAASVALTGALLPRTGALAQQGRAPIIDMHVHAQPPRPGDAPAPFWLPAGLTAPATEEEMQRATLDALRSLNVVKAVTSSASVDRVLRWKAAAPGRIVASVVFPAAQPPDVDSLRRLYREGRLEAFGEVIAQLAGLSPSDSLFEPYLALCEELDVPVGVHTGFPPPGAAYGGQPRTRAALGSPLLLEEALLRHRRLRVYIMHGGYPYLEDTIALLHAHPQVYVDLAGINWMLPRAEFHEYLRRFVQAGFGRRLMFGSDNMQWPGAIERAVQAVESAAFLTTADKRAIFYDNAARFLHLSPAEIAKHRAR